ncbi:MAG: aminotransferase class V-fold PLP-dependent enzyme [Candidatus Kariarchaeaceae archaeon]
MVIMKAEKMRQGVALEEGIVYLNHAAHTPLPKRTIQKMNKENNKRATIATLGSSFKEMEETTAEAQQDVLELINASNIDEITFVPYTVTGLHAVATGIDWKEGESIICNDLEFNSNAFMYQVLAQKYGLEVKVLKSRNGILLPEQFAEAIDNKTKLVTLSLVQFSNGFRAPVEEIGKIVHEEEALFLIDGIQGLGVMPVDVKKMGFDAITAGAYKWMMGPFNSGFLWVKEDLIPKLTTTMVGWWSDLDPMEMSYHTFRPAMNATRFQTSPVSETVTFAESIRFLKDDIGIDHIYQNVLSVTDYLIKEAINAELTFNTPLDKKYRSGVISLNVPNRDITGIADFLAERKIAVSERKGAIRVSVHGYNTNEDIDALLIGINDFTLQK